MTWLARSMKWIMLITGMLTASMFHYAIAPQSVAEPALQRTDKSQTTGFQSHPEIPIRAVV